MAAQKPPSSRSTKITASERAEDAYARFLHHVHRVQIVGIEVMTLQDSGGVGTLQ